LADAWPVYQEHDVGFLSLEGVDGSRPDIIVLSESSDYLPQFEQS